MLFVDDDEAELGERRLLPQQRVRADDDQRLPRRNAERGLASLSRGHLAGEQRRHDLGGELGPEHLRNGPQVLRSQNLGGGDQRGLPAGFGDLQHRPQCDESLSRSHLALDEPVHRPGAGEVGCDLLSDRLLVGGERVRQRLIESFEQSAGRSRVAVSP